LTQFGPGYKVADVNEKSHKGQRHKGCVLCDVEKRAGNGAERRPARDRRQIDAAKADLTDD
jgi:hypothetical protein